MNATEKAEAEEGRDWYLALLRKLIEREGPTDEEMSVLLAVQERLAMEPSDTIPLLRLYLTINAELDSRRRRALH
jgi:hypothetical protein